MKKFSFYIAWGENGGLRFERRKDLLRLVLWKIVFFVGFYDVDVIVGSCMETFTKHTALLVDFDEATSCVNHGAQCRDYRFNQLLRDEWGMDTLEMRTLIEGARDGRSSKTNTERS